MGVENGFFFDMKEQLDQDVLCNKKHQPNDSRQEDAAGSKQNVPEIKHNNSAASQYKVAFQTQPTKQTMLPVSPSLVLSMSKKSPTLVRCPHILPSEVIKVAHLSNLSQYDIIIDIRPFNNYSNSHVKNSVNICIPTTLLKRSSLDLPHLLNLVSIPDHFKDLLLNKIESDDAQDPLNVLIYDSNSSESHITLNLYQTILKFNDYKSSFRIHYLDGGFQNTFLNGQTSPQKSVNSSHSLSSAPSSSSPNSIAANSTLPSSPDSCDDMIEYSVQEKLAFSPPTFSVTSTGGSSPSSGSPSRPHYLSGFKLPSQTNYKTKFVNSIKKNSIFNEETDTLKVQTANIGSHQHLAYDHEFKFPKNYSSDTIAEFKYLPAWLGFLSKSTNPLLISNLLHKFNKIEKSEKMRLSSLATNNKEDAVKGFLHHHHGASEEMGSAMCSPIGLCPDCDETNYKIPKGIEYGFKNRYMNIWPYEHSRVKLQQNDENGDDYFNANFINCQSMVESDFTYIATQNPLKDTVKDFWQIIDNEEIKIIISLDHSPLLYLDGVDDIEIILNSVSTIVRKINKSIYHFEFKLWPDFGVPDDFDSILSLIQFKNSLYHNCLVSKAHNKIIVHCSAGCGRTGVFITIDNLINSFNADRQNFLTGSDDLIYKVIHYQRKQRISMVQNLDQYIVCYEILLYYLTNLEKFNSDAPLLLSNLMLESSLKSTSPAATNNSIKTQKVIADDYFSGLKSPYTKSVKSN